MPRVYDARSGSASNVTFATLPREPGELDREAFERDGFVVARRFVGARTIQSLVRAVNALVRAGRDLTHDATLHGAQYQVQSATGRPEEGAVEPGAFRKITFPHKSHRRFAMLRGDERLRPALESLGIRGARCVVDQVNLKLPRGGTGFPWHQDAQFLSWRQRADIEEHGGANVVIALDAGDTENGTFEVLAGTHHAGPRSFDYDLAGTNAGVWDASRRVALGLEPGDAAFFHPYLAHGSGPNLSARPRRFVTLWFVGDAAERGLRRR